MSQTHEIYVCGHASKPHFTTHISPRAEVDHPQGQVVVTKDGFFASARLPDADMLPMDLVKKLEGLIVGWARRSDHLPRTRVYNLCCP